MGPVQRRCLLALVTVLCVLASPPPSHLFAVIVSTSTFWFNLRHSSNALSMYATLRRSGVPDSRILLMLSDDGAGHACDARNPLLGTVYNLDGVGGGGEPSLFHARTGVDYAGGDVTADAVLRVLAGRTPPGTPARRRLDSGPHSRLLLYLTGHGGDGFLKFSDKEELASHDLAKALEAARLAGRFASALAVFDTCQAATLGEPIISPGVVVLSSSLRAENSYAAGFDSSLGLALADGFTRALYSFLRDDGEAGTGVPPTRRAPPPLLPRRPGGRHGGGGATLADFLASIPGWRIASTVHTRVDLAAGSGGEAALLQGLRLSAYFSEASEVVRVEE